MSDDRSDTKLYDIADDLHWDSKKNFTLLHSMEELKFIKVKNFRSK